MGIISCPPLWSKSFSLHCSNCRSSHIFATATTTIDRKSSLSNVFVINKTNDNEVSDGIWWMCKFFVFLNLGCVGWRLKAVLSVYVQRLNYSTQSRQRGFGSSSSHRRSKVLEFTAVVFDKFPTQTLEWQEMREAYMCHYVVPNHTALCWLSVIFISLFEAFGKLCC